MADATTLWSALGGAFGAAVGVVAKSLWDRYAGWQSSIPLETWKIRTHELERRLSEFYWHLYARLMRDDVVWKLVFLDLRPKRDREQPPWATRLSDDTRRTLSREMEAKVLLPNHAEAVGIIRSSIHLANADPDFLAPLAKYVRHVDAYSSLRSAGLLDQDRSMLVNATLMGSLKPSRFGFADTRLNTRNYCARRVCRISGRPLCPRSSAIWINRRHTLTPGGRHRDPECYKGHYNTRLRGEIKRVWSWRRRHKLKTSAMRVQSVGKHRERMHNHSRQT
jgi:hypothetical protein